MSLRENLPRPLVVDPQAEHTHTVVFLHRFPAETTDQELHAKVLSNKKTGLVKSLQLQYPTVRWVFPYPKLYPKGQEGRVTHWESLSPTDITELELESNDVPYITQVILQEARLAKGLDKVIVGGQGETAVAAHAAINRFPEIPPETKNNPEEVEDFMRQTFAGTWTEAVQFRLAGFVGMHSVGEEASQDQRTYLLVSKWPNKKTIKDNVILNTPHTFIHGGIKKAGDPHDGARIIEFANFLSNIGVPRTTKLKAIITPQVEPQKVVPRFTKADEPTSSEQLDSKLQHELAEREKYRELLLKRKRQEAEARERTLKAIEEDKIERKIRQERERRKLFNPDAAQTLPKECKSEDDDYNALLSQPTASSYEEADGKSEDAEDAYVKPVSRRRQRRGPMRGNGQVLGGVNVDSQQPSRIDMMESRIKALGGGKSEEQDEV